MTKSYECYLCKNYIIIEDNIVDNLFVFEIEDKKYPICKTCVNLIRQIANG